MNRMILFMAILSSALSAQDEKKQAPGRAASQKEIDEAVHKGVDFLKGAPSPGAHSGIKNSDELILFTLLHAGVSEKNEVFQKYLKAVLDAPLEKTYKVALQAMALEELDRATYQGRIAQCAQFLVDNQCKNGQWSYGKPDEFATDIPTTSEPKKSVATPVKEKDDRSGARDFGAERPRPKITRKIPVTKKKDGPESGDNSNSQYASLGLRACFDAGITLPEGVLQAARKWWVESLHADEGSTAGKDAVTTGGEAVKIQGWSYKTADQGKPTLPMTAGAVGATVIYEYLLGHDWKKDPVTKAGMAWLAKHFAISKNYYYLYALERAGMLYGTESIGTHAWYFEGAGFIVGDQNPDGSWGHRTKTEEDTWDTCFAILFLKRATRAIASEDPSKK
jgi:hypothetical protein